MTLPRPSPRPPAGNPSGGQGDRFAAFEGDFVSLAESLPPADVVVLDRVVCCYLEWEPLLAAAVDHSRRLLGFSYPRDRWHVRLVVWLENALRRIRHNPFRTCVHSPLAMETLVADRGFQKVAEAGSLGWSVALYRRTGAAVQPISRGAEGGF